MKLITDLWYEYQGEIEYLNIMIDDGEQEKILAQIFMPYKTFKNKTQEDLYNLCLEVAHDLDYILEGEYNDLLFEIKNKEEI